MSPGHLTSSGSTPSRGQVCQAFVASASIDRQVKSLSSPRIRAVSQRSGSKVGSTFFGIRQFKLQQVLSCPSWGSIALIGPCFSANTPYSYPKDGQTPRRGLRATISRSVEDWPRTSIPKRSTNPKSCRFSRSARDSHRLPHTTSATSVWPRRSATDIVSGSTTVGDVYRTQGGDYASWRASRDRSSLSPNSPACSRRCSVVAGSSRNSLIPCRQRCSY